MIDKDGESNLCCPNPDQSSFRNNIAESRLLEKSKCTNLSSPQ